MWAPSRRGSRGETDTAGRMCHSQDMQGGVGLCMCSACVVCWCVPKGLLMTYGFWTPPPLPLPAFACCDPCNINIPPKELYLYHQPFCLCCATMTFLNGPYSGG